MIVKQHCCSENTYFPDKMNNCESIPHTIASYLLNNEPLDHIISIQRHENTINISDVKVLPYLITDHKPIFCIVNDIPILSWNIEGLCNTKELTEQRMEEIKKILYNLHQSYPSIIFLFQELFLQSELKKNVSSLQRLKELFYHPDYTYKTDHYTSGIILPTSLFSNIKLIQRKNIKKNALLIFIKSIKPFYLVNIHLKSVQSFNQDTINNTHIQELDHILNQLKHKLIKGVVFIGDHNNKNVLPIYSKLVQ